VSSNRFCRKVLQAEHTQAPRVMTVAQNAADPVARAQLQADETSAAETKLRQSQDLKHVIEQDHCNIKRLVQPLLGCQSCNSASRTLSGMEAMGLISKGQGQGSSQGDSVSQVKYIEALFGVSV